MMMRSSLVLVALLSAPALGAPKVEDLVCKRTVKTLDDKPLVVVGIKAADYTSATSPDGSKKLANREKGGFSIVDTKTSKAKAAHNKDKSYDCDMAITDEGAANSVRWLGNDVVFAQGWFCEEFAAKPYLVNAKSGKFIGYLKVKDVSPEATYQFAPLDGSLWAASTYDHNGGMAAVVVFDVKSGKIKSTKKVEGADLAKLPDCSAK